MRIRVSLLLTIALFLGAPIATACEKCKYSYNYQAERDCATCIEANCGYYQCAVETDPYFQKDLCGSAYDAEGSDDCFTEWGIEKRQCMPDLMKEPALLASSSEWRLVRTTIEVRPMRAPADSLR